MSKKSKKTPVQTPVQLVAAAAEAMEVAPPNPPKRRDRSQLMIDLVLGGIVKIHGEYNGGGDSGAIDEMTCILVQGGDPQPLPNAYEHEVSDFCYDMLGKIHLDWINNEGGYGEFTWDLTKDKFKIKHNQRIESIDESKYQF